MSHASSIFNGAERFVKINYKLAEVFCICCYVDLVKLENTFTMVLLVFYFIPLIGIPLGNVLPWQEDGFRTIHYATAHPMKWLPNSTNELLHLFRTIVFLWPHCPSWAECGLFYAELWGFSLGYLQQGCCPVNNPCRRGMFHFSPHINSGNQCFLCF